MMKTDIISDRTVRCALEDVISSLRDHEHEAEIYESQIKKLEDRNVDLIEEVDMLNADNEILKGKISELEQALTEAYLTTTSYK